MSRCKSCNAFILTSVCLIALYFLFVTEPKHEGRRAVEEALKVPLLKDEVFFRRRHHLLKECGSVGRGAAIREFEGFEAVSANPQNLKNIIVDDKHKVLYCYIPKVACTNWKRMLLLLSSSTNYSDTRSIPSDAVHRDHVFSHLSQLQPKDIMERLVSYKKFIFVRHPIERLVSAFRNKFEKNYPSSKYFKSRFGVAILKQFRSGQNYSLSGDGVKFSEFVEYIIETFGREPRLLNEHWQTSTLLCHPCQIRYDFIGKYETLEKDTEYVLEKIGAPSMIKFPEVVPSHTTGLVDSYVFSLTRKQIEGLARVYGQDFRLFDYDFPKSRRP